MRTLALAVCLAAHAALLWGGRPKAPPLAPQEAAPYLLPIPPGYRAMSVPVDAAFASMVRPGDRCDLILVSEHRGRPYAGQFTSQRLVLGVTRGPRPSIALAVDFQAARYLRQALAIGDVVPTLRGPGDVESGSLEYATLDKLYRDAEWRDRYVTNSRLLRPG
ncbi:MAG: hypothetical protein HY553_06255 [Elusimicrobia bacterium]|nr:hypothetical protein [Elusimicrobiota bacterium]